MLGRLKKVALRDAWQNEATDFTNWLAEKENIDLLSEELGIDISVISTEYKIGSFNVDIYAQNNMDEKIIIENQLEKTDHDHLGKLITYASGINAKYIIWIVKNAREEHQSAIEWLNNVTNEECNFFLLEVEVWKIGNSECAPKFNVIEKPNNWNKALKIARTTKDNTGIRAKYFEFWEYYNEYVSENSKTIRERKPVLDHWTDYAIGTSKMYISVINNSRNKQISVGIWIPGDKELYKHFEKSKLIIEEKLQLGKLVWDEKPEKKASSIVYTINDFDLNDNSNWGSVAYKVLKASEIMKKIFIEYMK